MNGPEFLLASPGSSFEIEYPHLKNINKKKVSTAGNRVSIVALTKKKSPSQSCIILFSELLVCHEGAHEFTVHMVHIGDVVPRASFSGCFFFAGLWWTMVDLKKKLVIHRRYLTVTRCYKARNSTNGTAVSECMLKAPKCLMSENFG